MVILKCDIAPYTYLGFNSSLALFVTSFSTFHYSAPLYFRGKPRDITPRWVPIGPRYHGFLQKPPQNTVQLYENSPKLPRAGRGGHCRRKRYSRPRRLESCSRKGALGQVSFSRAVGSRVTNLQSLSLRRALCEMSLYFGASSPYFSDLRRGHEERQILKGNRDIGLARVCSPNFRRVP